MKSLVRLTIGIAGLALLGIVIVCYASHEKRQDQEQLTKVIATQQPVSNHSTAPR
jgi:hypothetical protein